jgi:hypothetical protein
LFSKGLEQPFGISGAYLDSKPLALTLAMIHALKMMKRRMTHEAGANQSLDRSMKLLHSQDQLQIEG